MKQQKAFKFSISAPAAFVFLSYTRGSTTENYMRKISCIATGATKAGEHNDCVVRALTNVTGKPYDEIHAVLKKHGRKDGKGTSLTTSANAMRELGFQAVVLKSYMKGNVTVKGEQRKTIGTVVKELPRGKFVLFVKDHATSLIDGQIVDTFPQAKVKPVYIVWWHPEITFKQ